MLCRDAAVSEQPFAVAQSNLTVRMAICTKQHDFSQQITMHARTSHISNASFASVSPDTARVATEDTKKRHEEERGGSFKDLIRDGVGNCMEPTQDPSDSSLFRAVCYSPAVQLKPGQVLPSKISLQCGNLFCLSPSDGCLTFELSKALFPYRRKATPLYCEKLAGVSLSCTIAQLCSLQMTSSQMPPLTA